MTTHHSISRAHQSKQRIVDASFRGERVARLRTQIDAPMPSENTDDSAEVRRPCPARSWPHRGGSNCVFWRGLWDETEGFGLGFDGLDHVTISSEMPGDAGLPARLCRTNQET